MKSQSRQAWAIHTGVDHGFIGRWYLTEWRAAEQPPQFSGYRTAVFNTRREAREALARIKRPEWGFRRARVCRVAVTIEEVPA